jgi:hypothetical protein
MKKLGSALGKLPAQGSGMLQKPASALGKLLAPGWGMTQKPAAVSTSYSHRA